MARDTEQSLRLHIDAATYTNQNTVLTELVSFASLDQSDRAAITARAAGWVRQIRAAADPGLMESFLAEYGLSTDEGIALMCLAEALLRVPDADTIDALIEDKIAPSDWGTHLGKSTSSLVNASTWALMLTGRVLDTRRPGPVSHLRSAIKRLGEPVIRTAVGRAMKEMGRQFVLGENITSAMKRAAGMEKKGYTYSYDMLGEAARTEADAKRYHLAYSRAISAIATACNQGDIRKNPGISVKLSALHPRYEVAQEEAVMNDLLPRLRSLALLAKSAGMGLNIDAEEADRLSLSLELIDRVLAEPALKGWDGLGVVVQAYGPRAGRVIDTLYDMAQTHDRRIMVRLVKGAYWDTEIKKAQVEGLDGFPVYSQKAATDVSYIANARRLLGMTDRIAQCAYGRCGAAHGCRSRNIRIPATAWDGRGVAQHRHGRCGHQLPHLCAGGRAPRSAGLSGAALAGERGKLVLREPDCRRRRVTRTGGKRSIRRAALPRPENPARHRTVPARATKLARL